MVCPSVQEIIHLLKLVDYLVIQTDKPWCNYSYLLINTMGALQYTGSINGTLSKSYIFRKLESIMALLQIRRGKRDNLGIIFHSTPLKHML